MVKLTHSTTSLERKDNRGNRKKKIEDVGKGDWEAKNLHRPNKTKWGEHDYTDEGQVLLNHLKPLMISALNTEFKTSKKSLLRVLNHNLLRGQHTIQ